MKNITIKSLILAAFTLLILPGCSKEESNESISENSFSVKIDGELFETTSVITGLVNSDQQLCNFTQFSITASKVQGSLLDEYMLLFFALPFGENLEEISYDYTNDDCVDPTNNICAYMLYAEGVENGKAGVSNDEDGSSRFTITSIDFKKGGHAKGTFSGTLMDGNSGELIEVTEGRFSVNIAN